MNKCKPVEQLRVLLLSMDGCRENWLAGIYDKQQFNLKLVEHFLQCAELLCYMDKGE